MKLLKNIKKRLLISILFSAILYVVFYPLQLKAFDWPWESESSRYSKCVVNLLSNTEEKSKAQISVESKDLKGDINVDNLMKKIVLPISDEIKKMHIKNCLCTSMKRAEFCPEKDDEEKKKLLDEIKRLKDELGKAKQDSDNKGKSIDELTAQKDELEKRVKEKDKLIQEITDLKIELGKVTRDSDNKVKTIADLNTEKKTLEKELKQRDNLIEAISKERNIAKSKLIYKGGNDGTANCEVFCKGREWPGGIGYCIAGQIAGTSERLECNEVAFQKKKRKVDVVCICADTEKIHDQ